MNKDYLNYIMKQLREASVLESAIGYEFTEQDKVAVDNIDDASFLSSSPLETTINVESVSNESRILLSAEFE